MNNQNEKRTTVALPDGRNIEVVQPGRKGSRNWRLTEEAYRRYESHIREAIKNWPKETKFEVPNGMSPNTFEHRLRDALQALILYRYDEDVYQNLAAIRTELHVSMDPSGSAVWIREKGQRGRPVAMHATSQDRANPVADRVVRPMPDETILRACAVQLQSGFVAEPFLFRGRLTPDVVSQLTKEYDIAFAYDETSDTTTML